MIIEFLEHIPSWTVPLVYITSLIVLVWSVFLPIQNILVRWLSMVTKRIAKVWGQPLLNEKVLRYLTHILPLVIFMFTSHLVKGLPHFLITLIERFSLIAILVLVLRSISILLDNFNRAYTTQDISRNRPIKGFIQVFLLLLHLLTFVLMVSIIIDKSPLIFISGLGAMTAVLLLVFRDTLLSLVAGLQLTSNNYISVGDWIEMPQFDADGAVIDIALHAVRVRNWDNTISVIPTHKFLEHSFRNWRGMQESGGRRIKRAINIDLSTVQFLTRDETEYFKRFVLLKDYITQKQVDLENYNQQFKEDPTLIVNARRLTNLGTFRAYLINYLKQHPQISQHMTFLVRQLHPTPQGVPIEIYVFTNDTRWAVYENIQSDIFDHVIAITKEFNLKIFQNPTGSDFQSSYLSKSQT